MMARRGTKIRREDAANPVVRRRRALRLVVIGAAAGTLAAACAGRVGADSPVGVSEKAAGGRPARDAGEVEVLDGAAALPRDYRSTFVKVNETRFVSEGHASGRWEVDVWANEGAHEALAARAREVPVGAIVVQEHYERSAREPSEPDARAPGPIMVMEKKPPGFSEEHGDWRWAVVGSRGQLVRDGVIEQCAGCHDDAPMDGLFPIDE